MRCAEAILKNGGHCAYEWPKGCDGWKIPELMADGLLQKAFAGCRRTSGMCIWFEGCQWESIPQKPVGCHVMLEIGAEFR